MRQYFCKRVGCDGHERGCHVTIRTGYDGAAVGRRVILKHLHRHTIQIAHTDTQTHTDTHTHTRTCKRHRQKPECRNEYSNTFSHPLIVSPQQIPHSSISTYLHSTTVMKSTVKHSGPYMLRYNPIHTQRTVKRRTIFPVWRIVANAAMQSSCSESSSPTIPNDSSTSSQSSAKPTHGHPDVSRQVGAHTEGSYAIGYALLSCYLPRSCRHVWDSAKQSQLTHS